MSTTPRTHAISHAALRWRHALRRWCPSSQHSRPSSPSPSPSWPVFCDGRTRRRTPQDPHLPKKRTMSFAVAPSCCWSERSWFLQTTISIPIVPWSGSLRPSVCGQKFSPFSDQILDSPVETDYLRTIDCQCNEEHDTQRSSLKK